MPKFIGTKEEFNKFFGGYCRNTVNRISKSSRDSLNGICQHCGHKAELQSAHIKGEERKTKMKNILDTHFVLESIIYSVDLDKFEKLFIESHMPIEEHFLFLCPDCHRKYDNSKDTNDVIVKIKVPESKGLVEENPATEVNDNEFYKKKYESIQDYIKRLLPLLDNEGYISKRVIEDLKDKRYSEMYLGINLPLLSMKPNINGHNRYWLNYKFKGYYVCSQWWKQYFEIYEEKIQQWVDRLISIKQQEKKNKDL